MRGRPGCGYTQQTERRGDKWIATNEHEPLIHQWRWWRHPPQNKVKWIDRILFVNRSSYRSCPALRVHAKRTAIMSTSQRDWKREWADGDGVEKKSIDSQARGRSQPNWEVFRQKKKEIYAAESPLYIYSKGLLCVISQPDMVRAVLCACCVGWVRDHFTDDWTCVLGRTNDKSFPTKTFFFHSSCLTFFCVCWL